MAGVSTITIDTCVAPPAPVPAAGCTAVRRTRYKSLDIWRGVACLSVLLLHSNSYFHESNPSPPWSWLSAVFGFGWLGVPMFFVISGYCISATADSTRRKGGGVREYFKRRVRRIFPPYWIFLGFAAVFAGVLEAVVPGLLSDSFHGILRPWQIGLRNWPGNLTLTETWLGPLLGHQQFFLDPAWTLCYEEQFYAVTGLLLIACRKRFFTGALAVTALTAVAILTKCALPGTFFDGRWFMFAAGIGVYYAINHATPAGKRRVTGLLLGGVAYALLHPRLPGGVPGHFKELLVALTFAVFILSIHRWDARMAEARVLAPLAFCGTLCYSLYLVHWPVAKAVSHGAVMLGVTSGAQTMLLVIPVSCALALLAAWGFHLAVEKRFMNAPGGGVEPERAHTRRDPAVRMQWKNEVPPPEKAAQPVTQAS